MYMALRTFQKNFMSPIFDNNSRGSEKIYSNLMILQYIRKNKIVLMWKFHWKAACSDTEEKCNNFD